MPKPSNTPIAALTRAVLLAAGLHLACSSALAQSSPVTIAVPLNVVQGKSPQEALEAIQQVVAFVRRQDGLTFERLLQSSLPGAKPEFVYVTNWRSQQDWEALYKSPEFLRLLSAQAGLVSTDLAGVFTPAR